MPAMPMMYNMMLLSELVVWAFLGACSSQIGVVHYLHRLAPINAHRPAADQKSTCHINLKS